MPENSLEGKFLCTICVSPGNYLRDIPPHDRPPPYAALIDLMGPGRASNRPDSLSLEAPEQNENSGTEREQARWPD